MMLEGFCQSSHVPFAEMPGGVAVFAQDFGDGNFFQRHAVEQWRWLDVHHTDASKGGAIESFKELLGFERVICFGDSDNDLSMFEAADESYAPANATDHIKSAATAVIGHHDEEGIARFLRERFALDES